MGGHRSIVLQLLRRARVREGSLKVLIRNDNSGEMDSLNANPLGSNSKSLGTNNAISNVNQERDNNATNEFLDDVVEYSTQKSSPTFQSIEKPNSGTPKSPDKIRPSWAEVVDKDLKEAASLEVHNLVSEKAGEDVEFMGRSVSDSDMQARWDKVTLEAKKTLAVGKSFGIEIRGDVNEVVKELASLEERDQQLKEN
ncbi:hypothetical protein V6N12_060015 [Hibiscus sabdariffa]|uniref:Uncharacterized protein n=1 Tax=Hibiscus sabdariffa TaxID=183260 RepID=A0ABR2D382_9ROSI